jgi:AcrR family transcriptional regulator
MAQASLRERKKALTRSAIEETSFRLFLERGYDETSLEEICDAALVSRRTFFRYFGSKEDLVLAPSKAELSRAAALLQDWPEDGAWRDALFALFDTITESLQPDAEMQVVRWKLVTSTPSLFAAYLGVTAGFEELVRAFLAARAKGDLDDGDVRLVAAVTATAFRVAAQTWTGRNGSGSLRELAEGNLRSVLANWA